MNIYYLKKFRKETNNELKLIKISHNLYYVARVYGNFWLCNDVTIPRSEDLPYEEALIKLRELRRKHILDKVYSKRLKRSEIVKDI